MGFLCGEKLMTAERGDADRLLKAVEAYRDATQRTLDACQRARKVAAESKDKPNRVPNIHFIYFPGSIDVATGIAVSGTGDGGNG